MLTFCQHYQLFLEMLLNDLFVHTEVIQGRPRTTTDQL